MNERERNDLARERRSNLLDGLRTTGKVLDNAQPYARQEFELKAVAARIKRVESGQEKV